MTKCTWAKRQTFAMLGKREKHIQKKIRNNMKVLSKSLWHSAAPRKNSICDFALMHMYMCLKPPSFQVNILVSIKHLHRVSEKSLVSSGETQRSRNYEKTSPLLFSVTMHRSLNIHRQLKNWKNYNWKKTKHFHRQCFHENHRLLTWIWRTFLMTWNDDERTRVFLTNNKRKIV